MAKDLMIIDPDDELVLATVCEFYDYGVNFEKEVSILKKILINNYIMSISVNREHHLISC